MDGSVEEEIKDAAGNIEWLLGRLRQEQEILILGFGIESQNAYGYFLGKGIEARCFAGGELLFQTGGQLGQADTCAAIHWL